MKIIEEVIFTVANKINSFFTKMNEKFVNNEFIKILRVQTFDNKSIHYIYIFGHRIYPKQSTINNNCKWYDEKRPIMYLKINRKAEYTLTCIQHWVNIAYELKSDLYFICDNKQLEYAVVNNIKFPDIGVKFLKSERKELKNICETVSTGKWINVACAQLTTFFHAEKQHAKRFWAIDADDTSFCLSDISCAKALLQVEKCANDKEITVMSLDMWHSRTKGKHWSWGVAYINDNVDLLNLCRENNDLSWINSGQYPFRLGSGETNTDWFFTYLKFVKQIRIETFYFENLWFIHWGNFIKFPGMVAAVYHWKEGKLSYPIYRYVHKNDNFGYIDIASDCIKIETNILDNERDNFFSRELNNLGDIK